MGNSAVFSTLSQPALSSHRLVKAATMKSMLRLVIVVTALAVVALLLVSNAAAATRRSASTTITHLRQLVDGNNEIHEPSRPDAFSQWMNPPASIDHHLRQLHNNDNNQTTAVEEPSSFFVAVFQWMQMDPDTLFALYGKNETIQDDDDVDAGGNIFEQQLCQFVIIPLSLLVYVPVSVLGTVLGAVGLGGLGEILAPLFSLFLSPMLICLLGNFPI